MGRMAGAAASGCGRGEERRSVGWLVDLAGRVTVGRSAGDVFFKVAFRPMGISIFP